MALQNLLDAWLDSMRAIAMLDLDTEQGERETSLPGWRVRDIVAHLVHLEEVLAFGAIGGGTASGDTADSTASNDTADSTASNGAEKLRGTVSADYTQRGVDELADVSLATLLTRLDAAVAERARQLDPPPSDSKAMAERTPNGLEWSWDKLLGNRAIDVWMHEQDIRLAIGAPSRLDAPGAAITMQSFVSALPFIVGKRAQVEQGHSVAFETSGPHARSRVVVVDESGRAVDTDEPARTTIAMSSEAFMRLAGGREPAESFDVRVSGDPEVASRILHSFAITP